MAFQKVTIDEAAEKLGKSRRTLERWKASGAEGFEMQAGMIFVDLEKLKNWRSSKRKSAPKKICPEPRTTSDNADKLNVGPSIDGGLISFHEAKRRKELANAMLAETKLQRERGQLIERERVYDAFRTAGNVVRSRAMALPARLAGRLCRITNTREMHKELDREMRDLCRALEDEFEKLAE